MTNEEPLNVAEAASFLKLVPGTVYKKFSRGELPGHRRSRRLYFFKNDLIKYIKGEEANT